MRSLSRMHVLSLLLSSLCLASCARVPPVTPVAQVVYPQALFQCQDKPNPSNVTTDNTLAVFIAQLSGAYDDCESRLHNLEGVVGGGK